MSDIHVFFEHQRDPDATEMAAFPARDKDAHLAHWKRILGDRTVVVRTVVVDEEVAGNVVSWKQDGRREVGYWIGKPYWGRGIATRALACLLQVLDERPLYAHVAKHNIASTRVLENCGFTVCMEDVSSSGPGVIEEVVFVLAK